MIKILIPLFFILIIFQVLICRENITNVSKTIIKTIDLDRDGKIDTVIVLSKNQNFIPIRVIWGLDTIERVKITEFVYPGSKIKQANYLIDEINYDSKYDIVINYQFYTNEDSNNRNPITRQYILYIDSVYKTINKIKLEMINKFQRKPFMANKFTKNELTKSEKYLKRNRLIIKEVSKKDTRYQKEQEGKSPIELKDETTYTIKIFPTPTMDILKIDNPTSQKFEYYIIDVNGQILLEGHLDSAIEMIINTSALMNGVYSLMLIAEGGERAEVHKFVIMR